MIDLTDECTLVMDTLVKRGLDGEDALAVCIATTCALAASRGFTLEEVSVVMQEGWHRFVDAARELDKELDELEKKPS